MIFFFSWDNFPSLVAPPSHNLAEWITSLSHGSDISHLLDNGTTWAPSSCQNPHCLMPAIMDLTSPFQNSNSLHGNELIILDLWHSLIADPQTASFMLPSLPLSCFFPSPPNTQKQGPWPLPDTFFDPFPWLQCLKYMVSLILPIWFYFLALILIGFMYGCFKRIWWVLK